MNSALKNTLEKKPFLYENHMKDNWRLFFHQKEAYGDKNGLEFIWDSIALNCVLIFKLKFLKFFIEHFLGFAHDDSIFAKTFCVYKIVTYLFQLLRLDLCNPGDITAHDFIVAESGNSVPIDFD